MAVFERPKMEVGNHRDGAAAFLWAFGGRFERDDREVWDESGVVRMRFTLESEVLRRACW